MTKVSRVTNNNTVWVTKKGVTVPNRWGYFVSFEKHASVGYIKCNFSYFNLFFMSVHKDKIYQNEILTNFSYDHNSSCHEIVPA